MTPQAPPLVHIVADAEVRGKLALLLGAAGVPSRGYSHLRLFLAEFLNDMSAAPPGCLVIDAQPTAICGLEAQAILLPLAIRCPIVVVENPLCARRMTAAIMAAIEEDRRKCFVALRCVEIRARFAKLTPRERQVMALVTAGMLNKQVGGDLGVSEITVKAHRGSAMRKMGARSLAELVRMADAIDLKVPDAPAVVRSARSPSVRNGGAADHHTG
jgi:FixJ family two-component response regulator